MFELNEAVRGRLIGPKTWNRSVRIFGSCLGNLGTVTDCYGFLCDNLLNKLCFGVYKTGNGYRIRFQKVKPRLDEWAAHGQPTAGFRDC